LTIIEVFVNQKRMNVCEHTGNDITGQLRL
jgi:hypothetical protein